MRPFFCCGSELSLVSIPDFKDDPTVDEDTELTNVSDSDDQVNVELLAPPPPCISSYVTQPSLSPHTGGRRIRNGVRKKKSEVLQDKNSWRKGKFWNLKFGGKLPRRVRYSNGQNSAESPPCVGTSYRRTDSGVNVPEEVSEESTGETLEPPMISMAAPIIFSTFQTQGISGSFQVTTRQLPSDPSIPAISWEDLLIPRDIEKEQRMARLREMRDGLDEGESSLNSHLGASSSPSKLSMAMTHQCMISIPIMDGTSAAAPEYASSTDYEDSGFITIKSPTYTTTPMIHTQVDFVHRLVPDLLQISGCCFYWGVMDRYEAEKYLENKPEGTFLLRDSAQEEFLFSVSFRRYGRSLHARIEQWRHQFSFDSHDPGVFAADTVCGLIEHYKDPMCCMFFEPMLTRPLNRNFCFSLQHLCRAMICHSTTYDGIGVLPLPNSLKDYLKYYHYKQKVRVKRFDTNVCYGATGGPPSH